MPHEELRNEILEVFKEQRQSPAGDFDETHFLDFLIHPPSVKNGLRNTFKGARAYYKFFCAMELKYGICFTVSDTDKYYGLDQLVSKVSVRIGNTRGNKKIIRDRMLEKENYMLEIVFMLILIPVVLYFKLHVVSLMALVLYGVAMRWTIGGRIADKRHNKALYKMIMERDGKECQRKS